MSHSVGCLPRLTEARIEQDYLTPWRIGTNWSDWMTVLDRFRAHIGERLGVDAATICPQTNISSALTKILHSLSDEVRRKDPARKVILLTRQDFPTIGFVVAQAERAGYEMRFIDGDVTNPAVWADSITDDVAFVHVTHALSNSSHVLPVQAICDRSRQAGALSIVDVAQSVIAVPTPVNDWQADFVTGTSVKFLCGGPGACFLYVAPERLADCRPVDVGWFSHDNPFEMDITRFRYADNAMRFFGGTPSPAPFICANAALSLWASLDLQAIHARIQDHLDRLSASVPDDQLVSPKDRNQRGATCVVNPHDRDALSARLDAASIRYDMRDSGFRFSVHGYTSDADISRLTECLRDL